MPDFESYILNEAETASREDMELLQLARLRQGLERVSARVPFYRDKLTGSNITASDIRSIQDLRRLPFTTKDDLRTNYPFGMLAVPLKEVIRIHASSGTTGKPTVVAYTRNDVALWSELMA